MDEIILVTHEIIMEKTKCYTPEEIRNHTYKIDFDSVDSIKRTTSGDAYAVHGIMHLYGYKVSGEKFGFYDVINHHYYLNTYIKGAQIIEYPKESLSETRESLVRRLKRK